MGTDLGGDLQVYLGAFACALKPAKRDCGILSNSQSSLSGGKSSGFAAGSISGMIRARLTHKLKHHKKT
jgi:hypothetical protein